MPPCAIEASAGALRKGRRKLSRLLVEAKKDVDARDKRGHDG
jgi:hypothetical protein